MFRSYDHLQVDIYMAVECTRSGSGFPSNATLVWIFYSVTANVSVLFPREETCSGYSIQYSNQCCVRRKPWTWAYLQSKTGFKREDGSWRVRAPELDGQATDCRNTRARWPSPSPLWPYSKVWGHITTEGRSWCGAALWDLRPDITSYQKVVFWKLLSSLRGAPSLTRGLPVS
jgi:hypothetical protein